MENEIIIRPATAEDARFIPHILDAIYEASKVPGNSIVMRDPDYLALKMKEGKAAIALKGEEFVGFCYLECWENQKFIANSGLIVRPEFRGQGIARGIKKIIVEICREMFPDASIFGITKSKSVMKMNQELGFRLASYDELTTDPKFWKGCNTCPHFQELLENDYKSCQCTGLLYKPEEHK